ncbi:MAG TPA: hypothetical protein VGJ36_01035 [Gemmatimonadales bacterium]|jgi:hypothetical protein
MTVLLLSSILALGAILMAAYVLTRRDRVRGIAPAGELQRKYRLYAENRPVVRLDPERVPPYLRHLVPLAEKWGIGDDIIRNDYIAKAEAREKRELHDALYQPFEQITEWLNSFGDQPMTDEAEAFMYMQGALDEMGYYILEEKTRAGGPHP